MQKLKTYHSIKIEAQNWSEFGFDDEYYLNAAILDLHLGDLEFTIPGIGENERLNLEKSEQDSLILTSTSLYPSPFFISCQ